MSTQPPIDRTEPSAGSALRPGLWKLDPNAGGIGFRTRKLGVIPVKGRFEDFDGELRVGEGGEVSGHLTIETASIATGFARRDADLRGERYFDAVAHPHMVFTGAATGGADRIVGKLRIREKEIAVDAPVSITTDGEKLWLVGGFEVDHDAAGLGWATPGIVRRSVTAEVELTFLWATA